jgi:hypothetical protein
VVSVINVIISFIGIKLKLVPCGTSLVKRLNNTAV